jgi:hypothetical protein
VIALGEDFAIQCYYSPDKRIRVHEVWLSTAEGSYFDRNADGSYDSRALYPAKGAREELPRSQVWYDGQWRDVADEGAGGKWIRTLQDGGMVEFDKECGHWLPVADGSAKQDHERRTGANEQAPSPE